MRGKVTSLSPSSVLYRITPACAGKSWSFRDERTRYKDHPRVCGEKRDRAGAGVSDLGSPPRVRGKGQALENVKSWDRITPACAGKRRCRRGKSSQYWDHPRVCGEKGVFIQNETLISGSPPRVRGKDTFFKRKISLSGITPACAGKSTVQH